VTKAQGDRGTDFGIIKEQMDNHRVNLRGSAKGDLEWRLVCFRVNHGSLNRNAKWIKVMGRGEGAK